MISKFEIESPDVFLASLDKKIPKNPDPNNLRRPGMNNIELKTFLKYVNKDTVMLEVGGGASSVYWSRLVKELVVVEPSETIANRIQESVSSMPKVAKVIMHCIPPNFQQKKLSVKAEPGQFENMIRFISEFPNEKFDLAFIDGRDRVKSAEACIHSVKIGGHIGVHDFWIRPRYHSLLKNKSLKPLNTIEDFVAKKNSLIMFERIA